MFDTCDVTSHDNVLYFYITTFVSYYYYVINICPFFLVIILLNLWCTPPLRRQVLDYNTFPAMFDVPSTAVFCKVYCVIVSLIFSYFFSSLVTIPVAPVVTGI